MNFDAVITKLNEDYEATVNSNSGEKYSKLSMIFEELGKLIREATQDQTADKMKDVIRKLKKGEYLDTDDLKLVRLWLVGDAEHYAKTENNFNDWEKELKRLIGEINKFKKDNLNIAEAAELRALFRDGSRVLADMFYYVQQKERVDKFNESTREIDDEERKILVRLLEQKLKSPDF